MHRLLSTGEECENGYAQIRFLVAASLLTLFGSWTERTRHMRRHAKIGRELTVIIDQALICQTRIQQRHSEAGAKRKDDAPTMDKSTRADNPFRTQNKETSYDTPERCRIRAIPNEQTKQHDS